MISAYFLFFGVQIILQHLTYPILPEQFWIQQLYFFIGTGHSWFPLVSQCPCLYSFQKPLTGFHLIALQEKLNRYVCVLIQ